jgi:tripartite-type tricarboxylate transporter receptor subunit TctC
MGANAMRAWMRRIGTGALVALSAGLMGDAATADTYPSRPVRILVPFAPGGAPDLVARMVGDKLGASLGQRFIAENRVGAGGNIASEMAAQAAPDGYTLYLAAHPPFTLNPMLYSKTAYDPIKDFEPISLLGSQWFVLTAGPALPVRSIQEFVAHVKARPGQLSYGSSGAGTPHHLGMEFLKLALGLDIQHVPYRGASLMVVDLVNGQLPIAFTSLTIARQHFDSGKLVPLAVSLRARSAALPGVPSVAETVLPSFEVTAWFGMVAPARTGKEIVATLSREIGAAMRQPDVLERMTALGLDTRTSTPGEMAEVIKAEVAQWARVVSEAKLKVE